MCKSASNTQTLDPLNHEQRSLKNVNERYLKNIKKKKHIYVQVILHINVQDDTYMGREREREREGERESERARDTYMCKSASNTQKQKIP